MKIVAFDKKTGVITNVYEGVYNPEIDREKGIIFHENGTFYNANSDKFDYLLLEDFVLVYQGQVVNEDIYNMDQSPKYNGFDLGDIADSIKRMGNEVKEEIKSLFDKEDD